jgi:hypothetical protein
MTADRDTTLPPLPDERLDALMSLHSPISHEEVLSIISEGRALRSERDARAEALREVRGLLGPMQPDERIEWLLSEAFIASSGSAPVAPEGTGEREAAAVRVEALLARYRAIGLPLAPGVERALEEAALAVRAGEMPIPVDTWAPETPAPEGGPEDEAVTCGECGGSGEGIYTPGIGARKCEECGGSGEVAAPAAAPAKEDARGMPDGTLVTCEHCPAPHAKGDDGRPCLFPKVAKEDDRG